ncbi:MAG: PadR family transcriptional regulator [Chthonomonas sp.]|nr:PadR family transcriptional regulator [Chthonomonas sp.]
MAARKFSTIEMTVLGMTYLRGPSTTYAVMMELSSSASTYHKSRAGTAYSVAKRLLKLGLIESLEDGRVQITPEGQRVLADWVGPDVPMMDVAHSADLLRLRFFFLEALSPADRLAFIDVSIRKLQEFERRCEGLIPQNEDIGDYFGALATVSSVLETRARIAWLRIVREWVVQPINAEPGWAERILDTLRPQP